MGYSSSSRLEIKTLTQPVFLIMSALYLLNRWLWPQSFFPNIIRDYLSDLFCVPIILTVALYVQRAFTFKNPGYIFRFWHVLFVTIYCSALFEWFLPKFSSKYVADIFDVVAYFIGGLFFYLFMNKPITDQTQYRKPSEVFNKE